MNSLRNSRLLIVLLASIPIINGELNGFYNPTLYRASPWLFWVVDVANFVLIPALLAFWLSRYKNIHPKHYGLQFSPRFADLLWSSIFFGILLFCAYYVAQCVGWAFTWRWYVPPEFSYGNAIPHGLFRAPVVLYMALTPGVMESIFMLALPWYFWRKYLNLAHLRTPFAFLSSAVFASCHWEQGPHNVIAAFVFGYASCLLYWKLNDLWPIIGAHTFVDIVEFF